jgi:hypothetical protein
MTTGDDPPAHSSHRPGWAPARPFSSCPTGRAQSRVWWRERPAEWVAHGPQGRHRGEDPRDGRSHGQEAEPVICGPWTGNPGHGASTSGRSNGEAGDGGATPPGRSVPPIEGAQESVAATRSVGPLGPTLGAEAGRQDLPLARHGPSEREVGRPTPRAPQSLAAHAFPLAHASGATRLLAPEWLRQARPPLPPPKGRRTGAIGERRGQHSS